MHTNRLVIVTPIALLVLPALIFGSTWGEELNHVWYSLGAAPSQSGLLPLAANNFGKVVVFGNPVYDFSIAAGARLPLQTGASGTIFVFLRHIFSTEVVAMFSMISIAIPALFVFNHTLMTLRVSNAWMRVGILSAYVSIPAYYITEFDWYSISIGYFAMATLVCVVILLLNFPHDDHGRNASSIPLLFALIVLTLAFPSSYISYFHVSIMVIVAALFAGRQRLVRAVRLTSAQVWVLVPLLTVSISALSLTVIDLLAAGSTQEDLIRNTNKTTLFSPLGNWASAKHSVLQTVTGDWRGVIGALSSGKVLKYAAANIPVTLFISAAAMFGALLLAVRDRLRPPMRIEVVDGFLVLGILSGILAMWWTPLPRELDVSDRNFYGHLATVSSLLLVGRLSGYISSTFQNRGKEMRARKALWYSLVVAFVANSLLLTPTALRTTIDNRKLLVAPNSLVSFVTRNGDVSGAAEVLGQIQPGQRVMSFTEGFDAQKYFQSSFGQFITYNDLTARGIPTVNAYPKIRDASNISMANRFSSSLAPSSLQIDVSTHCPLAAVRFLAVTTLVLSAQQTYNCRVDLSAERKLTTLNVGTRDGIVMFAHTFGDHPSYWLDTIDNSIGKCALIERMCWNSLQWNIDKSSRMNLVVHDDSSVNSPVTIVLSQVPRDDAWLILPLTFDERLKVTVIGSDQRLRAESVNGFVAIRPPKSSSNVELGVTISPDMRMYAYGLLPYAWVFSSLWSWSRWRRKRHWKHHSRLVSCHRNSQRAG